MKRYSFRGLVIMVALMLNISINAQQIDCKSDIKTINKKFSEKLPDPYKRPYIYRDEPSIIKKVNPVNILFGTSLYLYQNIFSKHISASCLYTPSCSEFSKDAIREYGVLKGVLLSVDRVNRCNLFSAMELKNHKSDPKTGRYPDPASRYKKSRNHAGN
jgi:putative membrane protein insertion efficiency factor